MSGYTIESHKKTQGDQNMIIITGGAGFIGSQLLEKLNNEAIDNILIVDNLSTSAKWKNLLGKKFRAYLHKDEFLLKLKEKKIEEKIDAIFHMGACSATTENNLDYLMKNNVEYSKKLFSFCKNRNIPFLYASSASVYGMGEQSYSDCHEKHLGYKPLNPYGFSKYHFDSWVLRQEKTLNMCFGLRFFNVYGKGEEHKGFMRSVVSKAKEEILANGTLKLFKSHHPDYKDGEQKRDFVYVKDIVDSLFDLWKNGKEAKYSGIYNLGSGEARSFYDLGKSVFEGLSKELNIEWIPMPKHLRNQYQYYTKAPMEKFRSLPFLDRSFHTLEEGISDYLL